MELAQDRLVRAAPRARLLLLARPAGGWWQSLTYRLSQLNIVADEINLMPLAYSLADRLVVFTAARDRFARLLEVASSELTQPSAGMIANDHFKMVLTIHMAALAAVDATARGEMSPTDPAAVSVYLLRREAEHWQALYDSDRRIETRPRIIARVVYTATLTRPLSRDTALSALGQMGIASEAEAGEKILEDHAVCYPPTEQGTFMEPLYPDRLGEDFIALQTPGHAVPGYTPDPWSDGILARLLSADRIKQESEWISSGLTILIEAARRWPHLAYRQLFPLLRANPQLAVAGGGSVLSGLASLPDMDLAVLEAIEPHLPEQRRVDLDVGIAAVIARLAEHRLPRATEDSERAGIYRTLGWRQANAGQYAQAAQAAEEAIQALQTLAQMDPQAYEGRLGQAQDDLGYSLSKLGRRDEALAHTRQAVEIYRRLVRTGAAGSELELAGALTDFGWNLSQLNSSDEAVIAATEAVKIWRRLCAPSDDGGSSAFEASPERYVSGLAGSLLVLGATRWKLGRTDEALTAAREAVEVRRWLAQGNPPGHEVDLAMSLSNLGVMLSNTHPEEALSVTRQAVEIGRRLAVASPAAVEPRLALWVTNLRNRLSELGQQDEALAATREAVDLWRRLAQVNPAEHEPDLAWSLGNLGIYLAQQGQQDEALAATREAVDLWRRLAQVNPAEHEPDLAWSLGNLGMLPGAAGPAG